MIIRPLIAFVLLVCVMPAALADEPATSAPPSPHEWRLIGGGAYEQHFSPIKQVNDTTIKKLGLAWFADMPTVDGLTGVPLVADGVVYQSGGLGWVWAHDLGTGKLRWSYDARIKFPTGLVASWGARMSRGLALWRDTVLKATGDCRLIALDRRTGVRRWEVQSCNPLEYKTITGAPRVGAGKVFIGNSNADSGIGRGYVDAYDIATGKHLWRFYTIPGDPSQPFENSAMEMASKTWGKEYWKHSGGGSPWEGITYDATTNLVYIGTDGPAPFAPTLRESGGGDELFTNAIVAVNADTGEYVWHYSTTPGDGWNYAATMPVVLADLVLNGEKRHVILSAPKNGFFYVLDARTGKLANEPKPIVPVNWASRIDMQTGRPVLLDDAKYWEKGKEGAMVSPSPMGAHNWMPMSYSPDTGLVYIPVTDYPVHASIDRANSVGRLDIDFYYGLRTILHSRARCWPGIPSSKKPAGAMTSARRTRAGPSRRPATWCSRARRPERSMPIGLIRASGFGPIRPAPEFSARRAPSSSTGGNTSWSRRGPGPRLPSASLQNSRAPPPGPLACSPSHSTAPPSCRRVPRTWKPSRSRPLRSPTRA